MALTEQQILKSKEKAKEYLEHSIFVLSTILGADLESLDENSSNPIDPSMTHTWNSYESLLLQIRSYAKLINEE
jgi:hypothetical protein